MLNSSVFLEESGGDGGGGGGSVPDVAAMELRNEGGSGGGEEEGDRNHAANRWPREETLALLKIRSDMDQAFRDVTAYKAPLWDEVSRKLGELGYNRNAKKCKEKFENIYKYHKRTKDGRSSRQNGKNYHFFYQLENFDTRLSVPSTSSNQLPFCAMETTEKATPTTTMAKMVVRPASSCQDFSMPCSTQDHSAEFMSPSTSTASSSGKESEESVKKKRKLTDYFERLMKEVLEKQEDLQKQFLEAIEKSEKDRIVREEEWKVQEKARLKREQELLAQERAIAAAKDAAVLAFLQKISQHTTLPVQLPENLIAILDKPSEKYGNVLEKPVNLQDNGTDETSTHADKQENSTGEITTQKSSSRWPKAEVEALIVLKTDLDMKYQDSGVKGTLWEEISSCMKKLGYVRNAKRCKEKWENINKYYKRVRDSSKKRPEYSKTCPYFSMLESIYAKKSKKPKHESENGGFNLKPEHILMEMMGNQQQQSQLPMGEYEDNEHKQDDYEEDEQDDDSGDGYQIVANDHSSVLLE